MAERRGLAGVRELADVQRRTAHESVHDALRHAILSGQLAGGTRLVQAELAAQFGVSNTPVREAMRQLATEGMIRFDPYRGAVVHSPDLLEVLEVYEIRLLLEPEAARKAALRITAAQLAQARQIHDEMAGIRDIGDWVPQNLRFHRVIIDAAGSPRLAAVILSLEHIAATHVALALNAGLHRMEHGHQEHAKILDALQSKDSDLVARLVAEHLEATVQAVRDAASAQPAAER